MLLVRCPKCGATCKSTDESCFICGCKLSDKQLTPINKTSNSNVKKSIDSENTYVEVIKERARKETKTFLILILSFLALFFVALIHSILVRVDSTETYKIGNETRTITVQTFSVGWVLVTCLFALVVIILIFELACVRSRKMIVNYVDGYCVIGYGIGNRWSLYINGILADPRGSVIYRVSRIPYEVELRGTLPNKERILVKFKCYSSEYCKIEKLGETVLES